MNEPTNDPRQEKLKQIIKDLHDGVPVAELQSTFADLIRETSPEEIAAMENALIQEGMPVAEVQRLCEVHAEVFDAALVKGKKPAKRPGHPVHTYMMENKKAKKRLKALAKLAKRCKKGKVTDKDVEALQAGFEDFRAYEKHYARKENQLFPALEAKGFTGPSKVMWGKHDEIRAAIKEAAHHLEAKAWDGFLKSFKAVRGKVEKMIFLEEKILYPTSVRKLDDAEWLAHHRGDAEIGYAWITPSDAWAKRHASAAAKACPIATNGTIPLSVGELTPAQIDMMLTRLPLDVTLIDEHDKVRYYTGREERTFPRSPNIIGRDVQNCHPPKSLHMVNAILAAFRKKEKDQAEFWIRMNDQFVHIRYFPLYDATGTYRGTIEVTRSKGSLLRCNRASID